MSVKTLGIIVGGGPAPGINGVIGAAAINAINHGFDVRGFYDGFRWLSTEQFDTQKHSVQLGIPDVARIHFEGGSILRTSRTSLLDKSSVCESAKVVADPASVKSVLDNLQKAGVTHLITIGGDDTALSARFVAEASQGAIRVAHVPKTIDNDLPLPGDLPTFGFNTARHLGSMLVANLMEDSRTTSRWYFVVAMGRNAGFLAYEIGKAAGATLSVIPEELPEHATVCDVVDILECAILKRRAMKRPDGVAVIAEGVAFKFGDVEELKKILGRDVPVDAAGHPRLAEFPLDQILKSEVKKRFDERGDSITIVSETLGYELRCARPTPFDMAYCRDLGFGAVSLLLEDEQTVSGVMVAVQGGDLIAVPFKDMIDPVSNRTRVRQVDLNSTPYRVARSYMIRLEQGDFDSPPSLSAIAAQAGMSPEDFSKRYKPVVDNAVVKLQTSIAHSQVVQIVDDPIEAHRDPTSSLLPM
ncbi:MAG: 6-phosphofructokinase [Planctomycetes bacterium]|nr:6-phosphofructokinase [Planctomycetota bacterium]